MVDRRILPVLAAVAVVSGCGLGSKDPLVAKVGNREIHASQVREAYLAMRPAARPPFGTLDQKRAYLDDLINKDLMEMAALEKYPELNDLQTRRLRRYREKELINAAKKRLIKDQIVITSAMKDTLYENMKRERLLGGMLILDPDAATYVRTQLDQGADFGTLARDYSMKWVSHVLKGDMGWTQAGTLPYPIDVAVWSAPVGSLLGPIPNPQGSYLFKVLDERAAVPPMDSRADADRLLEQKILEPLYLDRQKEVQDSLFAAADPYFPAAGKALLNLKYYWEPGPGEEDNQFAQLDAARVVPTFTAAEETVTVVDFKTIPDWTAKEFAQRLTDVPSGMWPTGASEDQLLDTFKVMIREFLYLKAARDLGLENAAFEKDMASRERQMRVTYFYYNDVERKFSPTDAEVDSFYHANQEKYRAPTSYKVAVFGMKDSTVAAALAEDWKKGTDFEALRAKYQKRDPDLVAVGETEWLYEGQDPVRDDLVTPLKEGGVSEPLTRQGVVMVVKLIARRAPRYLTFEEVKDDVTKDAKTSLVDQKLSSLLQGEREKYGVTIKEKALAALTIPEGTAAPADSEGDAANGE